MLQVCIRIIFVLSASLIATHAASQDLSGWSDKTICRLAKATPDNVEYQAESTKRGLSCGVPVTQKSSRSSSKKVERALAGIDIENDPNVDFFRPPQRPIPLVDLYGGGFQWKMADFNKDGYTDVLYIGGMRPDNFNLTGVDTAGLCGGDACTGEKPLPSLLLGDADRQLTYSPELLIDNREDNGMSAGRQLLVADYNNDQVLDFYVADHGLGTHNGVRDSYFLSQPNGTWVESSETHLSDSNFVVFDHGAATGDIDNDGDMDVVITGGPHKSPFTCWVNSGEGFLKKRQCGGIFAFGLELADMDGDGDLDALLGAEETDKNIDFTGIIWNDGRGNFNTHNNTSLPQHKKHYSGIGEVSASDLDNDGDLDIVYARVGYLYVGTAVQIIENLGNKKFKDHGLLPLVEAPADYIPTHEGNEWNDYINAIRFRDLDKDGDLDLYFSNTLSQKTNGMVLLNEGDFVFEILHPHGAASNVISASTYESYDLSINTKTPVSDTQKAEDQEMADELSDFEAQLAKELAEAPAIAIAKRKAKVAAAKAKRIAEEAAQQVIEDELAVFEEELEAELAE